LTEHAARPSVSKYKTEVKVKWLQNRKQKGNESKYYVISHRKVGER